MESSTFLPLWRGGEITLACVGVGARRLREMAGVPDVNTFQLLIMAGVAGALSPELRCGDIVVDAADRSPALPNLGKVIHGKVHTATKIAATPQEKSQLFQQTGCVAVDMETQPAREFAASHGAACVSIRGISDAAEESLNPTVLTLMDADGKPRMSKALAKLARHPGILPTLLRLRRTTNEAMAGVAQTVERLIASGWPTTTADRPHPI